MPDSKIDNLKEKFSTGKIPSEEDFIELIDVSNMANKALGQDEKPKLLKGMAIKDGVLGIVEADNSGLLIDEHGISVKANNGITIKEGFLTVNTKAGLGVEINPTDKKIGLKIGKGLVADNNGLALQLGGSLGFDGKDKVIIATGDGLTTDSENKLKVNLLPSGKNSGSGLSVGAEGLKIAIDTTLNTLEINKDGKLSLTQDAIKILSEGSKNKFKNALKAAHDAAQKKFIRVSLPTLGDKDEWATPITTLITEANDIGQKQITRAIDSLAGYLKGRYPETHFSYECPSINYSFSKSDSELEKYCLYSLKDNYKFSTVDQYLFKNDKWDFISPSDDSLKREGDKNTFDKNTLPSIGFWAFIGRLDTNNKISHDGPKSTYNAIIIHNTGNDVSVIGYLDLTKSASEFYPVEADPLTNDITRVAKDLTADDISLFVNDNSEKINFDGGNDAQINYTSSDESILTVDLNGTIKTKKWSNHPVNVTLSQPATRTKNSQRYDRAQVTVKPLPSKPLTVSSVEKSFRFGQRKEKLPTLHNLVSEGNHGFDIVYSLDNVDIATIDNKTGVVTLKDDTRRAITIKVNATQAATNLYDINSTSYQIDILDQILKADFEYKLHRVERFVKSEGDHYRSRLFISFDSFQGTGNFRFTAKYPNREFALFVEKTADEVRKAMANGGELRVDWIVSRAEYENQTLYYCSSLSVVILHQKDEDHDSVTKGNTDVNWD